MVRIYTLTLAPSLDSATITPQIYPEGKLRCTAPVFEPGGGGINVARAIAHLGGSATAIFPAGGATGEHLVSLLADENVPVATVEAKDWTRQNLHVHVEASGEQYRFVMPGAALNEDEFRQLEEQVLEIESGAILVISGSLPPGVKLEKLTQLISAAQKQGIDLTVDFNRGFFQAIDEFAVRNTVLTCCCVDTRNPQLTELTLTLTTVTVSILTSFDNSLEGNAVYARTRTVVAFSLFQNFLVTCTCNNTTFYASHMCSPVSIF